MSDAFIVSAARTPIGRFQGGLASLAAPKLGAIAVKEAVARAAVPPDAVEEAFMGCVIQAGLGQNPARQAALGAGLPPSVGAVTVNKVCGSGLKSIVFAAQAIRTGDARLVVAGGMESMTNAPYLMPDARAGSRLGHAKLLDAMIHDGLWDVTNDFHMGITCELVGEKYGVTRKDMDEFAFHSHRKAVAAAKEGRFKREIVAVPVPGAKGETRLVESDEGPRADASVEKMATMKPAFKPDGLVTAANSSQISDGAAAVVVAAAGVGKPLARITGYAVGGLEPKWVMMTPVEAVKNWERKTGLKRADMDLVELNEAFAGQGVAVIRELGLDAARVNVNGGAVALGHPIGASGARIVVTLIHALQDRKLRRGLATLCMGGGNGLALSLELA